MGVGQRNSLTTKCSFTTTMPSYLLLFTLGLFLSSGSDAEVKEETEGPEHVVGCGARKADFFFWGWGAEVGSMCTSSSMCALGGPLDLLQDHVTPIKMPSPGTQHTNRIRVSGFETGKHEGGEEQRTAQGWGLEARWEAGESTLRAMKVGHK